MQRGWKSAALALVATAALASSAFAQRGGGGFGRKYRRAYGHGQIRAQDDAGHRPAGDRFLFPDDPRGERDARPWCQCKL